MREKNTYLGREKIHTHLFSFKIDFHEFHRTPSGFTLLNYWWCQIGTKATHLFYLKKMRTKEKLIKINR